MGSTASSASEDRGRQFHFRFGGQGNLEHLTGGLPVETGDSVLVFDRAAL